MPIKSVDVERISREPVKSDERRLWALLAGQAQGQANALKHKAIQERTGLTYTQTQRAAMGLVLKYYPLGSSEDGLFACVDREDFEAAADQLDRYIWPIMARKRALEKTRDVFVKCEDDSTRDQLLKGGARLLHKPAIQTDFAGRLVVARPRRTRSQ